MNQPIFLGFEPAAERRDAVLDEIEPRACMTSYLAWSVAVRISSGTPKAAQISARENLRFSKNCRSLLESSGLMISETPARKVGLSAKPAPAFTVFNRGDDLLLLIGVERFFGTDD